MSLLDDYGTWQHDIKKFKHFLSLLELGFNNINVVRSLGGLGMR